jgi:hypothetical protein
MPIQDRFLQQNPACFVSPPQPPTLHYRDTINSSELSPWEITSYAANQEFHILWNPNVHYSGHKSPPMVPILNQINLVHATPSYFSKIRFSIILSPPSMSS